jgi:hypothetical protein
LPDEIHHPFPFARYSISDQANFSMLSLTGRSKGALQKLKIIPRDTDPVTVDLTDSPLM